LTTIDARPRYIADALELESSRWRDQDGHQSVATAARKRGLAANWLTPMRSRTANIGSEGSVPRPHVDAGGSLLVVVLLIAAMIVVRLPPAASPRVADPANLRDVEPLAPSLRYHRRYDDDEWRERYRYRPSYGYYGPRWDGEGAIGIALVPVAAGAASAAEESRTAIVAHRSLDEWISLMESVTVPG
jgi:hypothetical protein